MEEYLSKLKTISDNLLMAGSPISTEDLITHALIGLGGEYTPIVVQLSNKIGLTWIELQATLLTFESRLDLLNNLSNLNLTQPNVNFVSSKSGSKGNSSNENRSWRGRNPRGRGGRLGNGRKLCVKS